MKWFMALYRRTAVCAAISLTAVLGVAGSANAQQYVGDFLRTNPKVVKLFRSVVADASESTVRVKCDGKDAALGTIVAADGWIVTKASELTGKIVCRLKDGEEYPAKVVGEEKEFDLAMLKIDAEDLKPVEWEDSKAATVGRWVASVAPAADPVAIGVVSVATRKFKPGDQPPKDNLAAAGWLGVSLGDDTRGVRITSIEPKGPADKAGLMKDDVVTHINGKKVLSVEAMINSIQKFRPGDEITLNYIRDDEENDLRAKLEKRPLKLLGGNPQERMGSMLSGRRGGFPIILQHDTILKPADCGGPLVDLDGKAVGINISRAGRTETYAIPSEAVRDLLSRLMSGELAPKREEK
jgi:serine protease Do